MKGEETTLCYGNRNLRPWQYCPEEKQFVSGTAHLGLARLKQAVLDAELAVPSAWFESLLPNKKGTDATNNATTSIYARPKASMGMAWSGGVSAPARGFAAPLDFSDGRDSGCRHGKRSPVRTESSHPTSECVETVVKVWHNRSHEGVSA